MDQRTERTQKGLWMEKRCVFDNIPPSVDVCVCACIQAWRRVILCVCVCAENGLGFRFAEEGTRELFNNKTLFVIKEKLE